MSVISGLCDITFLWGGVLWCQLWNRVRWNFFIFLIHRLSLWRTLGKKNKNNVDIPNQFKAQSLGVVTDGRWHRSTGCVNSPKLVQTCSAQTQILPHCLYCLWHFLSWKEDKRKEIFSWWKFIKNENELLKIHKAGHFYHLGVEMYCKK